MISSGINPADMAYQLMLAERTPKDQLFAVQKAQYEAQLAAYKAIETKLNSFSDSMSAITDDAFSKKGVTVSDEDMANITAGSDAASGDYAFYVKQLASAHQLSWEFDSIDGPLPAGEISLSVGGETMTLNMADYADLNEVRDAINNSDLNPGVQASLVQSGDKVHLVLTGAETGEGNAISVAHNGADITASLNEMAKAQDAIVLMGETNPIEIRSASNTLDNAISGLTIELKQVHQTDASGNFIGGPLRVSVGQDNEAITESVQTFIDEYNALIDEIGKYTFGKSVGGEDGDDSGADVGVLSGDSALRSLSQRLRSELYEASPDGLRLSDIGIEVTRDGKLELNTTEFEEALSTQGDKVQNLFSAEGGLFDRLDSAIATHTATDGYLKNRQDSMEQNIQRVDDRMEQHDMRMEQVYNRYLAQFVRVEQLTLQMQQSSSLFY
ncbi:flagellar filament capping protein FliD [Ferrimonas balearica]|uniref:flagellar filament capping protein FliD n=1 Tax=Ferrimonas balearica TaxID=44012 RepID=UPI001C56CDDA|nr:flagellar filament capping protein FliD [Ferrimonas balearica]MBW3139405.1 flagellar filament capping protein FliD [Ferrimonas balearica]MBW3163006.1 flagellar filament capping protein FliD [Ferrimonas balearica]MBY6106473.1 flagellar filament capping protein FliD [Ferrimonas balearica]